MYGTQGGITVLYLIDQNTNRTYVIHRVKRHMLAVHLLPDAVDMFWSAADVCVDINLGHFRTNNSNGIIDVAFPIYPALIEEGSDLFVIHWFEITKRQVFQFPFDLPNPQAIR